ncbi:integrase [Mycobacterium intracellulare]|uniref:site-specific integrase n=1 Tax=Mycobacterium intracellulare TaxID=1767 RepID=UPI0007E99013|nr:site-specific integrase [Mycobacterium intracellulare]OBH40528.1 integrase [Mycobacterium intracellulare]
MAGRPPLRIGQHGKISRTKLSNGAWLARCRYRDMDGVTRIVERRGPADEFDQHGKLAEDVLIESLKERRPPAAAEEVALGTPVSALVERHLERLVEDGRSPVTISTYKFAAGKLDKFIGGVRVGEATPARVDAAIRSMRTAHGATMARQAKTLLKGAMQLAVMASVLSANPVRDVQPIRSKAQPKGATALTGTQLRELLGELRASEYCRERDLVDPITVFIATGLRPSELFGLRWADFDAEAGTVTVAGVVIRAQGEGMRWKDAPKTTAGARTIKLPAFATDTLTARQSRPYLGEQTVIFPSTAGTWRDPNNFRKQWRQVRDDLGVPDATPYSFRKAVATLIDDEGLSPRIGADQLGHAKVSMTQDRYMSRGRMHTEVAELLDRTISDE